MPLYHIHKFVYDTEQSCWRMPQMPQCLSLYIYGSFLYNFGHDGDVLGIKNIQTWIWDGLSPCLVLLVSFGSILVSVLIFLRLDP